MSTMSMVLIFLISTNILLLLSLVLIGKKNFLNKNLLKLLYIIFIVSLLILCLFSIYKSHNNLSSKNKDLITDYPSSIEEFNVSNDVKPENKKMEPKDELRTKVNKLVLNEFGENFKYTKDFLFNSDGTYTVSLLFDDTNYSKSQCKDFIEKLSNNLKGLNNVSRIEVYFLNNFKIKYSLTIDNFNKGNTSVTIKEDAF